jgi:hypothetical protein
MMLYWVLVVIQVRLVLLAVLRNFWTYLVGCQLKRNCHHFLIIFLNSSSSCTKIHWHIRKELVLTTWLLTFKLLQPTYNLGFIIITGIYISESAFSKLLVRLYEH